MEQGSPPKHYDKSRTSHLVRHSVFNPECCWDVQSPAQAMILRVPGDPMSGHGPSDRKIKKKVKKQPSAQKKMTSGPSDPRIVTGKKKTQKKRRVVEAGRPESKRPSTPGPSKDNVSKPRNLSRPGGLAASHRSGSRVGISSKPMGVGRTKDHFGSSRTEKDSIFVGVIRVGSSTASGTIVWSRRNTASVPGTYLEVVSGLYNRWHVRMLRYRFVPVPGADFAGQIIGATDPDPNSVYDDVTTNVQRMSVLAGRQIEQLWKGISFTYPLPHDRSDLWTRDLDPAVNDQADRFSIAGNSMIAIVAKGDIAEGTEIGSVFLDYDYVFYEPRLAPTAVTSSYVMNMNRVAGNGKAGNIFLECDPTTGEPKINEGKSVDPEVDLAKTAMDAVTAVIATADAVADTAEVIAEGIETIREYVEWTLEPSKAERKDGGDHYPPGVLKRGRYKKFGAAATEEPGFAYGHYLLRIDWYTEQSPMGYDETAGTIDGLTPQLTCLNNASGGELTYIRYPVPEGYGIGGSADTAPLLTTGSCLFYDPINNHSHPYLNSWELEFQVTSNRGFATSVIQSVQQTGDYTFKSHSNDIMIWTFTRRSPQRYVVYETGDVKRKSSAPVPAVRRIAPPTFSGKPVRRRTDIKVPPRPKAPDPEIKIARPISDGTVKISDDDLVIVDDSEAAALKENVKTLQRKLALIENRSPPAAAPKGPV